jgi:signal transduction histidine kinase
LNHLEKSDSLVQSSQEKIDQTIQELRYLSRVYIAPKIEENGLEKEIQRFLGLIQSIYQFNAQLDFDLKDENALSQYVKLTLYRTMQEAVGNSIVHGQSTELFIQLISSEDNIIINVEDNGSLSEQEFSEGSGLQGIRSRLSDYVHDVKLNELIKEPG